MPAPAKPRPKPPLPPNLIEVSGTQEQFLSAGFELAAALGWKGEPTDETNNIDVQDAQNFLVKTMHEVFQAAAKGEDMPSFMAACQHLGIEDAAEQALVEIALKKEYEAGKGAKISLVDKTI